MRLNYGKSDHFIQFFILLILTIIAFLCVYPMFYVLSMSISDPYLIAKETLWFWPKGFSTLAFGEVFKNPSIWRSYYNTIWYTCIGTLINVSLTIMLAYPLARKEFSTRKVLMFIIAFTMLFNGGLIPSYVLVNNLGLYNTRWSIILPSAISAWNTIIARTFFEGIPDSIPESAKIDGANDITILFRIILPISKPILAVLAIYYAVGHWNSYLPALIYIPNAKLHPLQLFLMKVLIQNEDIADMVDLSMDKIFVKEQLKYAVIVVSVVPIMTIYPFFQKYFVQGVMVGSIKG